MEKVVGYTDGSASVRDRTGGWAFVICKNNGSQNLNRTESGFVADTTVNRMEMTAVINALHYAYGHFPQMKKIQINSDSKYVVDTVFFEWYKTWESRNWVNAEGGPTANADLWQEMGAILKRYKFRKIAVDIRWVRGHDGNFYNEVCDKMAGQARLNLKINKNYLASENS